MTETEVNEQKLADATAYANLRYIETGQHYIVNSFYCAVSDCTHNRIQLKKWGESVLYSTKESTCTN